MNYTNGFQFLKQSLVKFLLYLCPVFSFAQTFDLWQEVPDALSNSAYTEAPIFDAHNNLVKTSQVKLPTLTVFEPKNSNGLSVLICPGGGYRHLAFEKEGVKVAKWLNDLGITAFVLKYRLPSALIMKDPKWGPLQDAQHALRWVRINHKKWGLNPEKIGIMGFSAGGHLAATLLTHYNYETYQNEWPVSAKPNFGILVYPVVSMQDGITHAGSKQHLLGQNPEGKWENFFSLEKQAHSQMPPVYMVHAKDDKSVIPANSELLQKALNVQHVPNRLLLVESGGHGFGLGKDEESSRWLKDCEQWLKSIKILNK